MSVRYTTERFASNTTDHFTTDIATNAIDIESIPFPTDWATCQFQKIMITGITMVHDNPTQAAYDWEVGLWATAAGAHASNIDSESLIQIFTFDAANAVESPTGADIFWYETNADMNMPVDYVDNDNTSKVHVSLTNRGAATYDPTAAGVDRVKIIFQAEPVL
jgi:hypothetical protein